MLDAVTRSTGAVAPRFERKPRLGRRVVGVLVGLLLGIYAVQVITASREKGVSFDEGLQLAVGYNIWLNGDLRIEGANGDLVKRWATLPYLLSKPQFVTRDDPDWKASRAYNLAHSFLFRLGNRPEALLLQGRVMILLLGLVTGYWIFIGSREIFGPSGGLISLTVFTFSPAMLAFGGIVSTDMSITLTLFGTTWCVWRLLHEITWPRVAGSLVMTALMVLAKPTALVIFPITAALIAVKLAKGGPLQLRWRSNCHRFTTRRAQLGIFVALALAHFTAGWAAIWAHYDFRYAASPIPADPNLVFFQPTSRDAVPGTLETVLRWIERTHLLPEGYRAGIDALLRCDDGLGSFMRGTWKINGQPAFFPYAIWVKTPPGIFILLGLGGVLWWRDRHERKAAAAPEGGVTTRMPGAYATVPHVTLIVCYLAVAMTEDMNIGHRHVLPIYPSLAVLTGAATLAWRRRSRSAQVAVLGSILWLAAETWAIRPHFLAYFGPQAGGAANGYKHLVDSSLDWGMDLPGLKRWIHAHDPAGRKKLFLGYFGTDSPSHHGIKATLLPGFFDLRKLEPYPLEPGYYAISASLLQSVYTAPFGPWNRNYEEMYQSMIQKLVANPPADSRAGGATRQSHVRWASDFDLFDNLRFARLCAWLRHQGPPPYHVGHALFIWKLDYADLEAALLGPPVELTDEPPALRRFRSFGEPSQ